MLAVTLDPVPMMPITSAERAVLGTLFGSLARQFSRLLS